MAGSGIAGRGRGLAGRRGRRYALCLAFVLSPAPAEPTGGSVRLRLGARTVLAARPRDDTYRLRLTRSSSRYAGFWSLNGASWKGLGLGVNCKLATGAAYGLIALGPGRTGALPYAAFAAFRVVTTS